MFQKVFYRKYRVDIEITRGCKWNCKFCQVCRFYKYKEALYDSVLKLISEIDPTDWKKYKLGFVSADLMSYSHIEDLFEHLSGIEHVKQIGSFSVSPHAPSLKKLRRILDIDFSFSLRNISVGIEGVSERLRSLVGKPLSNEVFRNLLYMIAEDQRCKSLRLHFIKGLPTEKESDYIEFIDFLEEVVPLTNNFPLRISFVQFVPMVGSYWQNKPFVDGDVLYEGVFKKWYVENFVSLSKKGLITEMSMMSRGKWIEWMINKGGEDMNYIFKNWTIQYEGTVRERFYKKFLKMISML